MDSKKTTQVVTKTYGTSWVTSLIIAFVIGAVGYLISYPDIRGFIVGFVMTMFCELLVLASMIPFVGIYLQYVWSLQLCQWIMQLGGFSTSSPMNTLLYIPLILFMVFGAIVFAVITGVVIVVIGALIFR